MPLRREPAPKRYGRPAMPSNPRYESGLAVRKEVLGAGYVEAALARATDFSRSMQELVTEACWGGIWTRPGLDRRTRSLINLAMLTALNRPHELKAHLRGALTNGATEEEIRETLLQAAIYCGMPAGVDAFRTADTLFDEMRGDG
jgi:4-carboxymuconolactone decarboxylase